MDAKWAKKRSQSVCDVSLIATQKDDHDNINIMQKLASRRKNSANAQKRDTLMSVRTRSTTNLGENELVGADNSNSRRRSCFREELSQFRNWMSRRLSLQPSSGRKSSRGQEQEVLVDAEEHDQHENSFSDEDSHIMEIPDFLIVDRSFLKPVVQEQRRRFSLFS